MHRPILNNQALNIQPWFLVLLACYTVLELSFNHRLLELAGDLQWRATPLQLNDIEIWGRVVSVLGLGLLLMRWLDIFVRSRVLLLVMCCALGLFSMWHAQKALVDNIVARADAQDLAMSWKSQMSTQEALNGRILLRGEPLLTSPAPADIRPVMSALWASSVAGLLPEDLDSDSGAAQLMNGFFATQISQPQLGRGLPQDGHDPCGLGRLLAVWIAQPVSTFCGFDGLGLDRFWARTLVATLQVMVASLLDVVVHGAELVAWQCLDRIACLPPCGQSSPLDRSALFGPFCRVECAR